jgi:hypothetical protein
MLTFSTESWTKIRAELEPLFNLHWREMPMDENIPQCMDEDTYAKLEQIGWLHVLTARDEGKLVGYYVSLITRHLHYNVLISACDIYFLLPDYRRATNALRMLMAYEQAMRDIMQQRGSKYLLLLSDSRLDQAGSLGAVLERLGWTRARVSYKKRLEG